MCGIIGVVSRRPTRGVPEQADILAALDRAIELAADPAAAATAAAVADVELRGVPGVTALVDRHELHAAITSRLDRLDAAVDSFDAALEAGTHDADELERRGAASIALRDVLWAIRHDRLRTAREVAVLAGRGASEGAIAGYLAIQQ